MYTEFYGLKEVPFGLTPNPKYIYKTESYHEVVSSLKYCISQSKGLVVVAGEVGTGKTTTLRSVLQQFGPDILPVYLFNPFITVSEFFELFTAGLNLGLSPSASKAAILTALCACFAQRHSKGLRTVLIIDEAHGLSSAVLEEVRLLANFETNSEKLLQIILCGQPELRETLNRPGLRQLKQRISLRCVIKPLRQYEINYYIRFRLKTAGAERVNIFDSEAVDLIARASAGIPRVINNICDNALLYGYASGQAVISRDIISEVIETLDITPTDSTCGETLELNESVESVS
ncbi:MAG TPA: AAA family ATPase [Blastocatellia bacterium]|jgi:type II secretory pathway predicted ATPase ExeA